MHSADILFSVFLVYVSAIVFGDISRRLKLPAVVGEIIAGCIIGPYALNLFTPSEPLEVLAEMGAVLLLFSVGLETRIGDLRRVGRVSTQVGVAGVALPFAVGAVWALTSGFDVDKAMFVAAAFVATSAGITARVLQDLGVLQAIESRVILGAAVIDDILAMLLLGVVSSLQGGESVDLLELAVVLVQAIAFIALVAFVGTKAMRKSSKLLDSPIDPLSPLTLSLAGCLGLAVAASHLGLAAIIGAFLAGTILAESEQRHLLEAQTKTIMAFLVPFFFVVTGAKVDLGLLASPSILLTVLVVTFLAFLSKFLGCGIAASSLGRKSATIVGIGMVPRGEVGIIIASLGLQAGIFPNTTYSVIIAMSILTSIVAPPLLTKLFRT
jgi:Kef-type K+ transport system membrane component KefB